MKGYAIHTIHRKPDPKGEVEVIEAGAVFDTTKDELTGYARDGAARVATKVDEAAHQERVAERERHRAEIDPLAINLDAPDSGADGTGGGAGQSRPALAGMNKETLLKTAAAEGVTVADGATNAQIAEAIEAHRRSSDAPPAE
jgi:hypothetical protein